MTLAGWVTLPFHCNVIDEVENNECENTMEQDVTPARSSLIVRFKAKGTLDIDVSTKRVIRMKLLTEGAMMSAVPV